MIINDLDDYYIVFDTKNRNTELDTLENNLLILFIFMIILTPYSFSLTYNILYVQ